MNKPVVSGTALPTEGYTKALRHLIEALLKLNKE